MVDHVDRMKTIGDISTDSQRVEPTTTTGRDGTMGTSALASTSTFPLHLIDSGFVSVCREFLLQLLDQQLELANCFSQIKTQLAILSCLIWPWVWTTFEAYKVRVKAKIIPTIEWFMRDLHRCIDRGPNRSITLRGLSS